MEPITYKLNPGNLAFETYYPDVSKFTDRVLDQSQSTLYPIVREFQNYISTYELEETRTTDEYLFELINIGLLWRVYGGVALSVKYAPFRFLSALFEWRKKHQQLKPAIDILRGILMTSFLKPGNKILATKSYPSLSDVERLTFWLEATGDFREDALRFILWHAFLNFQIPSKTEEILKCAVEFARWFESESLIQLGRYTLNVDKFLSHESRRYRWREDRIICTRSRPEYHLNMIGAEIMNRSFRRSFLNSDRKAVLIPGCMRIHAENDCKAIRVSEGLQCSGCESSCTVNRLRALCEKRDTEVYILPHASDLSRWMSKPGDPLQGVVGVACVSMLINGGWELKRYGIPAQCVLLNFCGCKKHWDSKGIPTNLDMQEMKRVLSTETHVTSDPNEPIQNAQEENYLKEVEKFPS